MVVCRHLLVLQDEHSCLAPGPSGPVEYEGKTGDDARASNSSQSKSHVSCIYAVLETGCLGRARASEITRRVPGIDGIDDIDDIDDIDNSLGQLLASGEQTSMRQTKATCLVHFCSRVSLLRSSSKKASGVPQVGGQDLWS